MGSVLSVVNITTQVRHSAAASGEQHCYWQRCCVQWLPWDGGRDCRQLSHRLVQVWQHVRASLSIEIRSQFFFVLMLRPMLLSLLVSCLHTRSFICSQCTHTEREKLVHSSNHSVVCSSSAHGSVCSTRAHVFVCGRLMVLLISHSCVISTQHCPLSVLLVSITTRTCSTVRRRLPASTPTSLGSCRMRAFLRVRLASRSVSQTFEQWSIKRRMAVPSLALQNVNSGSGCGDIITSRRSVQRKGWRHSQKWCDAPDSTD